MLCPPHHLSATTSDGRCCAAEAWFYSSDQSFSVCGGWFVGSLRFCVLFAVICSVRGGWFAGVRPFSRWVYGVLFFPAVVVRCVLNSAPPSPSFFSGGVALGARSGFIFCSFGCLPLPFVFPFVCGVQFFCSVDLLFRLLLLFCGSGGFSVFLFCFPFCVWCFAFCLVFVFCCVDLRWLR